MCGSAREDFIAFGYSPCAENRSTLSHPTPPHPTHPTAPTLPSNEDEDDDDDDDDDK